MDLKKYLNFSIIIVSIWLLDQGTKWFVLNYMEPYKKVVKITSFLNLIHIRNPGLTFGLLADKDDMIQLFLIVFTVIAIVLIICFYFTSKSSAFKMWGCALLIGGAVGNLTDRLLYRNVVDFIDFHLERYHWPAFNIADSSISIGICLILWYFFKEKR
jgi:signal peptidase II